MPALVDPVQQFGASLCPFETMLHSFEIVKCPLCVTKRRYLPADIFQSRLSHDLRDPPAESKSAVIYGRDETGHSEGKRRNKSRRNRGHRQTGLLQHW